MKLVKYYIKPYINSNVGNLIISALTKIYQLLLGSKKPAKKQKTPTLGRCLFVNGGG